MQLVEATADFKLKGRSYPGFPVLLNDSMRSCEPANAFMRYYLLRGAIGSTRSWESTGRALYDYFSFLQAHDMAWDAAGDAHGPTFVSAYRDYCLDVIELHPNTVRHRLVYVCAFYEYAQRRGWVRNLPFDYEDRVVRRSGGFLGHTDGSGGLVKVRDVQPKQVRDLVKFLDRSDAKALMLAATNPHHRMMIRFGLQTGLRRQEIASFPTSYVAAAARSIGGKNYARITLNPRDGSGMRTKGSRTRDIFVTATLVRALHRYVKQVRGLRAQLAEADPPQLFLNQRGQPFAADGKGIERIVRDIGRSIGLVVHPHMLRHTYATHTLHERQRSKSSVDPLVSLQRQLGHQSIQTTMVYLHLVQSMADEAVLTYDAELEQGWLE